MVEIYKGVEFGLDFSLAEVGVPGKTSEQLAELDYKASLHNQALNRKFVASGTVADGKVSFSYTNIETDNMPCGVYDLDIYVADKSYMWKRHRFARVIQSSASNTVAS